MKISTIVKTFALRSAARGKRKHKTSKEESVHKEGSTNEVPEDESQTKEIDEHNIPAQAFTFRQMAAATNNFSSDNLVGEGAFGRVYKGHLQGIDKAVAIKRLDRSGQQGNKEFLSEVFTLSLLSHPCLVNLIGYCADGEQRMLVYEFMENGSLEHHLLDLPPDKEPLDWQTRMKIAAGAAKGLQYLHESANPPIIYGDFKTSNVLLDEDFNPKLCDFGLSKNGGTYGDKDHLSSTCVMGTYGYCAPEYGSTGQLTTKSDVYSFGIVLLELISGRRAVEPTKPTEEQNIVTWAEPLFKDRNTFTKTVDPRLGDNFPVKGLHQALAVATICLQEEPSIRPLVGDIVTALESIINPTNVDEGPTGEEPENLGGEPESQSEEPQTRCDEPNSPPKDEPNSSLDDKPNSPPVDELEGPDDEPTSPVDEPNSPPVDDPDDEDGSSTEELESPTGIIIRGNDIEVDVK